MHGWVGGEIGLGVCGWGFCRCYCELLLGVSLVVSLFRVLSGEGWRVATERVFTELLVGVAEAREKYFKGVFSNLGMCVILG